ncbi:MAG: Flp family type IVb pilin [Acidimicrobiia bacterium]
MPHEAVHADHDERGASMVEYALLVALIALVAIAALDLFGDEVFNSYSSTTNQVASAVN